MNYKRINVKYELLADTLFSTKILGQNIDTEYIRLAPDGILTLKTGYQWDGASGPAIDTKAFIEASLPHDGLYQAIREGLLSPRFRELADETMRHYMEKFGKKYARNWFTRRLAKFRAWYAYKAVRKFGKSYAT